jgi:hypothetical protein
VSPIRKVTSSHHVEPINPEPITLAKSRRHLSNGAASASAAANLPLAPPNQASKGNVIVTPSHTWSSPGSPAPELCIDLPLWEPVLAKGAAPGPHPRFTNRALAGTRAMTRKVGPAAHPMFAVDVLQKRTGRDVRRNCCCCRESPPASPFGRWTSWPWQHRRTLPGYIFASPRIFRARVAYKTA